MQGPVEQMQVSDDLPVDSALKALNTLKYRTLWTQCIGELKYITYTFHVHRRPQQRRQCFVRQAQAGEGCQGHEALVCQVVDAKGSLCMSHAVFEAAAAPESCCCFSGACAHTCCFLILCRRDSTELQRAMPGRCTLMCASSAAYQMPVNAACLVTRQRLTVQPSASQPPKRGCLFPMHAVLLALVSQGMQKSGAA